MRRASSRLNPRSAGRLLLGAAWLLLACGVLWLTSARARGADARELSSAEEADLRGGKLVVRPTERQFHGRQLIGGMSWQLIDADVARVYQALTDVSAHVKYMPAAEEVRLVAPGPPQLLFVQHRLGLIRASYYVHKTTDPARKSMRIQLDHSRPAAIRDAWAEVNVHAYGPERSIVSLIVMADLGEGLVASVIRSNVHTWMLRVPVLLKRYVEAQGGTRAANKR